MSTYATREDLIRACLDELKVTSYGTPPSAEEHAAVDTRIDGILRELSARNIVNVGNPDEIPDELLIPLGQVVARYLGPRFSLTIDEMERMFGPEAHPNSPENRLRAINRATPVWQPTQPDYF